MTLIHDPHALKLYIDGNCYDNPGGAGAFACVAVYPDDWNREPEPVFDEGFHETTNQRMELSACIRAYEYVAENAAILKVSRVIVVTDSMYVYENHRRAAAWRTNDWANAAGRPVENSDLWKKFLSVQSRVRVRTELAWHKGKKTDVLKQVDRAAKAAGKNPRRTDFGYRGGKFARSKVAGGSSVMYPAAGQTPRIRIYRTALNRKDRHKITFDLFSEESGTYVQKCFAYADRSIAAVLHRGHCYRVRFNADLRHPRIEEILEELRC